MDLNCPDCGAPMILKQKENGDNYYGCTTEKCCGYLGCHAGTTAPVGTPATLEVRYLRYKCHKRFDRLWKDGHFTRTGAYKWLATWFRLPPVKAHIGMFDKEDCLRLMKLLDDFFASQTKKRDIRKSKQQKRASRLKRKSREAEYDEYAGWK
jgi:ssDNA-binding Zn-finger/Zn-ribbon topoisomerase 1